ncbi:hypothetical protein C5167_033458 [Papaver somniferum]|uniref:Uncharacterized protein n=1 Tax=Papaver somniferum TaxID=3469 RepID=A0A4Y7KED5_PAPSO|nr:hypothetical protein C5167_033458 [Papaver somniferum]
MEDFNLLAADGIVFIVFVLLRLPKKLVKKSRRLVRKRCKKKNKKKNEKKIMEVEKVLTEFSQQGEFAFGSFWGQRDDSRRLQPDLERMEFTEGDLVYAKTSGYLTT